MQRISEAADRVDEAFDRLVRSEDALESLSARDAETATRIAEAKDAERYNLFQRILNDGSDCFYG
jgi:hypothetical protein